MDKELKSEWYVVVKSMAGNWIDDFIEFGSLKRCERRKDELEKHEPDSIFKIAHRWLYEEIIN